MFAKLFEQIFDSSIAEDWKTRLVFEDMLILADQNGVVDKTHEAISRRTNVPIDIVRESIKKLEDVDPKSRNPRNEGRRIVRLDEHRDWGWLIVNYEEYRKIASEEQRRQKTLERVRKHREKNKTVTQCNALLRSVNDSPSASASTSVSIKGGSGGELSGLVDKIIDCRPEFRNINRMSIENVLRDGPIEDVRKAVEVFCADMAGALDLPRIPAKYLAGYIRNQNKPEQAAKKSLFVVQKQLEEARKQRDKMKNRYFFNGKIEEKKKEEYQAIVQKVKELEKQVLET